jgi:hypothetical protein
MICSVEITKKYTSEEEAFEEIGEFINNSISEGFVSDTLSSHSYRLYKQGIQTEITITSIENSPNYMLNIKAVRKNE